MRPVGARAGRGRAREAHRTPRVRPGLLGLAGLAAIACGTEPWPAYFEGGGPVLDAVEPAEARSLRGGEQVTIRGTGLATARTVVIGGRTAELVEATDTALTAILPDQAAGGGTVDVAVATDEGIARLRDAFTWAVDGHAWWAEETGSAAVVRLECPVEITAWAEGGPERLYWCGFEQGEAWSLASLGRLPQPGVAGDAAGLVPVSTLPPVGEVVVVAPWELPPERPAGLEPWPAGAGLELHAAQRFQRHLAFLEERMDLAATWYSGWDAAEAVEGPYASLYTDRGAWLGDVAVVGGDGEVLELAEAPDPSATAVQLGFGVTEAIDGESYLTEAFTATAHGAVDGATFVAGPTGARLTYDPVTGWFFGEGAIGREGMSDVLPGVEYGVATTRLDQTTEHGTVLGPVALTGVAPDLLSGEVTIDRGEDLAITWDPLPAPETTPTFLGVELRVYDLDVHDPNGWAEVARLVARGDDLEGSLVVPSSELQALPDAPNALDATGLAGRWAELTIARHTLRKVTTGDEQALVVDFVHAVQSTVRLQ